MPYSCNNLVSYLKKIYFVKHRLIKKKKKEESLNCMILTVLIKNLMRIHAQIYEVTT